MTDKYARCDIMKGLFTIQCLFYSLLGRMHTVAHVRHDASILLEMVGMHIYKLTFYLLFMGNSKSLIN